MQKAGILMDARFLYHLYRSFVFYKLRNFVQRTVQRCTDLIQRFGFHVFIGTKATDSFAVNTALLTQYVRGNAFFSIVSQSLSNCIIHSPPILTFI